MSAKGYLLIDGSNILFAATSLPKKLTIGEGDGALQTQGIMMGLWMIRGACARFPGLEPIVLWDGRSWRHGFFPEYKANRAQPAAPGAVPDPSLPAPTKHELEMASIKHHVVTGMPYLKKALLTLGVRQIAARNLEADDLAGMLTRKLKTDTNRIMLISGDRDWQQLIAKGVAWFNPISMNATGSKPLVSISNFKEVTGCPCTRTFLEKKALIGDISDNIPGVGGIGEKGAIALIEKFNGVGGFLTRWIDGTIPDPSKLPKKFRDFAESDEKQHIYRRNLQIMDLASPKIPRPVDLKVVSQPLNEEGFELICRRLMFSSILDNRTFTVPFGGTERPPREQIAA